VWGVANQHPLPELLRAVRVGALQDVVIVALWLFLLLVMLRFCAREQPPVMTGAIGAIFWMSAVLGYYIYYITVTNLHLDPTSNDADLFDWPTLGQFFTKDILPWLVLAAVGGFGIGWAWARARACICSVMKR